MPNLVIHDNDFLKCVYELLPFEGMVCASMNVVSPNHVVRKMGIGVMRIDIDPSLFSLAVIMTTNRSGKEEEYTVFINVSEGIENLQNYISSRHFQEEVVNTKFTSN